MSKNEDNKISRTQIKIQPGRIKILYGCSVIRN